MDCNVNHRATWLHQDTDSLSSLRYRAIVNAYFAALLHDTVAVGGVWVCLFICMCRRPLKSSTKEPDFV
jgi:hypothetical protein